MSETVDVNVLVYATNADAPQHERAGALLQHLVAGPGLVVLFWPTVMGYLRIATHPSICERPLSLDEAMGNVDALRSRPHVRMAGEGDRFWTSLRRATVDVSVRGNLVPDAQIVALMLEHGVGTNWSHDRDFRKFDGVTVRDPFRDRYSSGFA